MSNTSGDPGGDGTTWDTAFVTLQQGLDAAVAGDEVWVMEGMYPENITLKSGVAVYGGFGGSETERAQRDPAVHVVLLDGGQIGSVVTVPSGAGLSTILDGFTIENGSGTYLGISGVVSGGGIFAENASPTITNNIIRNNTVVPEDYAAGGGIYITASTGVIERNTFTANTVQTQGLFNTFGGAIRGTGFNGSIRANTFEDNGNCDYGGAIDLSGGSNCRIENNTFTANTGSYGGGLRFLNSSPTFTGNTLSRNVALQGGGIFAYGTSNGTVTNNTFDSNSVDYAGTDNGAGGGLMMDMNASPRIERNVFTGNHGNFGGAIYAFRGSTSQIISNLMVNNAAKSLGGAVECNQSSVRLYNNTISGNTAPTGALYFVGGSRPTLVNNIVAFNASGLWKDTASVVTMRSNNVFGNVAYDFSGLSDPTGTNGNIREDPLFSDRSTGNFHLSPNSPCVNTGDDSIVAGTQLDLDGKPRISGSHVDIGVYEYVNVPVPFTMSDVRQALGLCSGLLSGTMDDLTRLNVEPGGTGLDMQDALRLARKVAGLEPNP